MLISDVRNHQKKYPSSILSLDSLFWQVFGNDLASRDLKIPDTEKCTLLSIAFRNMETNAKTYRAGCRRLQRQLDEKSQGLLFDIFVNDKNE